MEKYLTEILTHAKACQEENWSPICPRCGNFLMQPVSAENSWSRYADIYICPPCGTDEALRDYTKKPMRLSAWHVVRKALEGKTFLDLLRSGREFECDLVIDNSDMPATFVWDGENPLTAYGAEYYAALMESPYNILPNGNIEVFCDDYEIGKHFTLAAAGSISQNEYKKLFGHMELARDDISVDRELSVEETGISAYIETWFDVDEKFEISTADNDDLTVNFYALYHPEQDALRCYYTIQSTDKATEHDYYPTINEAQLIKTMMEEVCNRECGHDLLSLWKVEGVTVSEGEPEMIIQSEWFVTDDSCWQCCREVSEKVYELIQVCKAGEKYAAARGIINLDDYTTDQWEEYTEFFGHDGLAGFINDYDKTFPIRIIAEYIFEMNWLNYLLEESFDTFDDAASYVADVVDCKIDLS